MLVTRSWLSAVVTSIITASFALPAQGQPSSAAPDKAAAQLAEIVGRVETLDVPVVGITFQGNLEPSVGDVFEVILSAPGGERGRVAKGKITFAKNGVLLGRCDETTGEIAVGLEVRIAARNPRPIAEANSQEAMPPEAATAVQTPPSESARTPPATTSTPVDPTKLSGLFVGDDAQFPFVLQAERRGDATVVRGLGRMPYSAAEPTPIMTEFVGISVADDPQSLRGVLTLQPDGKLLKEPIRSPWVGLYDPAGDGWQFMFSPKHVVGASRPGVASKRGDKPATATYNAEDFIQTGSQYFNTSQLNSPDDINAIATVVRRSTDAHLDAVAAAALHHQAQLGIRWNQARTALADIGGRMSSTGRPRPTQLNPAAADNELSAQDVRDYFDNGQLILRALENSLLADSDADGAQPPAAGGNTGAPRSPPARATGSTTSSTATGGSSAANNATPVAPPQPPAPAVDYWVGRSFDEFMADQWARGRGRDPISYTLVAAPNAARAGQVARVVRDAAGRVIEIVNYGSAPDGPNVAQGDATTTTTGGASQNIPPSSNGGAGSTAGAGSGSATGGGTNSGTPPGNGDVPRTPDTTSLVNNDGSNRVPGSPPNMPPPSDPGTPPNTPPATPPTTTRTPPPAPPVAPPRTSGSEPITRGPVRSGRDSGQVYDPNITVLVDEDSGQAPTRALTQAQIDAARAALNRNMVAAGVQTRAKGPKGTDEEHHHDAPGKKPEEKKLHPLAGTWKFTGASTKLAQGLEKGLSVQMVITVDGQSIHLASNANGPQYGLRTNTAEGTIDGPDKGAYTIEFKGDMGGQTVTLSTDGSTMTMTSQIDAAVAMTYQRVK